MINNKINELYKKYHEQNNETEKLKIKNELIEEVIPLANRVAEHNLMLIEYRIIKPYIINAIKTYKSIFAENPLMLNDVINKIEKDGIFNKLNKNKVLTYFEMIKGQHIHLNNEEDTTWNEEKSLNQIQYEEIVDFILNKNLFLLTDDEINILKLLYGLDKNEEHSIEELSKMYNLTPKQIQQIEFHAIYKIRNYFKSQRKSIITFNIDEEKCKRLYEYALNNCLLNPKEIVILESKYGQKRLSDELLAELYHEKVEDIKKLRKDTLRKIMYKNYLETSEEIQNKTRCLNI